MVSRANSYLINKKNPSYGVKIMAFDIKNYDSSWDDSNEDLFDKKYEEWEKRDWKKWLNLNLTFPFEVERVEDEDDAYFSKGATKEPFRLGHKMKVIKIEDFDDFYGILVKAREGRRTAIIPLCELEVTSKSNINYWPVKEFVVWFANR